MSSRTATYNSRQLGHFMVPIINSALDYAEDVEWAQSIKPIFETTQPSTRYIGARAGQVTIRFALDVQSDASLNSDLKMMEQYEDIITDITPTVGSKTGADLVITDGVQTFTYSNSQPRSLKKILNIQGLMVLEITFICPSSPTIT